MSSFHALHKGRTRLAAVVGVAAITVAGSFAIAAPGASGATGSNGEAHTYPGVQCSAKVGSSTITQSQDITVWAIAPDSVAPGEVFTVSLPSIAADLPSSAQGLKITSYKDLKTTYRVSGATVVAGSGTNDGPATINGSPTPAQTNVTSTDIAPTIPGPIPPGHLVPPNSSAQIVAPSSGSISISAIVVTTTARINGSTDAVATCPVPANTLTTTQVEGSSSTTGAPSTTAAPSTSTTGAPTTTTTAPTGGTTTTTVPSGGTDALQCQISGVIQVRPGVTATSTTAPKNRATRVTVKGTMTSCSGGPSGTSAAVTNGTFTSGGLLVKTTAGQPLPTCSDLEHATLARSSTSKLQNGTTKVTNLVGKVSFGPMAGDAPVTFNVDGTINTKGPFKGKPLHVHLVTSLDRAGWNAACAAPKGLMDLNFGSPSTYVVGTLPPPTTTTTSTTAAPTTTTSTTASTTTTAAPTTTTTQAPTTTTTVKPNPIPPAVGQAILVACNTLGATASLVGVDISPLTLACELVVGGEGSFLLQVFLVSPSLGCGFLAGVPVVNNPILAAACVTFTIALQPFTTQIAALIPQGLF